MILPEAGDLILQILLAESIVNIGNLLKVLFAII